MTVKMYEDDNAHHADEDYRSGPRMFLDMASALAEARRIVDDFLAEAHEPGMTGRDLFESYKAFGPDPWIVANENGPLVPFSAWDYARSRCEEKARTKTT
ncbi:hypothetical protein RI103_14135 [Paraburkholderia sp. FT54]|uniref:hypothetical protein n=1 Tax=Paraburkholderia sp. FT54 TaxID=3074437 RepID=UPI00287775A6|nr:hypothetical protein [Paraburkholderia sp. FT54]WNC88838.1 hypothetical protein RI103_14135 [Paraburkholderia sp. FT54]